ncbi:copper chaperone PCu(A)C [Vibrio sp. S9_S30]|uniref:copper chaperone PCu(A)C n=1 Tax=Vibrio sp. S9_S30 TaxID=2720226 RepID=UPI001680D777|nr:copper chaperone PCu(A)C [Vibrio sp. S9_S30]MBD1557069.1 copper chaperone PCu(A)C [Vibrio sp. S9_S30]
MKRKALLLAALTLAPLVSAAESDSLMIHEPYVRATPPNAPTSAAFMHIMNRSDKDRVIVSATTSAAGRVELHINIKDNDVMKMRQVETIAIPANSNVSLKPGGLHIMLFDLKQALKEGESVEINLTFANGDTKTVKAPIQKVLSGMENKHNH